MLYADALICLRSMEFIADHSVTIGSGDLRATLAPAHTTKNRTADRTLRGIVKQHDRSWFALIAFFLLTTLASSLVFAAVFAAVTAAIGDSAQTGDELQVDPLVPGQNFSGIVSDAHCGSTPEDSEKNASDCASICLRNGSRYAIVNGDKEYEFAGELWQIGQFAGPWMTPTGVLDRETIKVSSARLATANAISGNNMKGEAKSRSIPSSVPPSLKASGLLPFLASDSRDGAALEGEPNVVHDSAMLNLGAVETTWTPVERALCVFGRHGYAVSNLNRG
jgi:hypothetical protein